MSLLFLVATFYLLSNYGISTSPLASPTATNCETVLKSETCIRLRGIAVLFHERIGVVDEAVQSALAKHITITQDVLNYVKEYLVDRAANFKCEDVLSNTQCTNLKNTANNFHVSIASLTKDIEEAIVDGISSGKALYQKTIEIMLSKIKNLSCNQLITSDTCSKILSFAAKIHASAKEVNNAIIDAFSKGLTNAQDFLDDAIEYLTNELSCDDVLSRLSCSKLSYMSSKFGTSFSKLVEFLRSSYANGITKISSLYEAATGFIMESWMGLLPFNRKRRRRNLQQRENVIVMKEHMTEEQFMLFLDHVERHMLKRNTMTTSK